MRRVLAWYSVLRSKLLSYFTHLTDSARIGLGYLRLRKSLEFPCGVYFAKSLSVIRHCRKETDVEKEAQV